MKKLLGIFLASLAMFGFGAAFWMTPLTTSFFMASLDDETAGRRLKEMFPASGTYYVPSQRNPPAELTRLHEAGPVATIHIRHEGSPVMDAKYAAFQAEGVNVAIRFAPNVRLTQDAVKLLTHAFKGYRFTPDGVSIPLSGPKVMQQVEDMLNVLAKALEHGKTPSNGNGANGNGSSLSGHSAYTRQKVGRKI